MKTTFTSLIQKTVFFLSLIFCLFTQGYAQPGNALNFDGTNDYVNIGTAPGVYAVGSSYTKEAWVLYTGPNVDNAENIVSSKDVFLIDGGKLSAANNFNNTFIIHVADANNFPQNHWVHVAVTYDVATTTMKLYKNGVEVASNTGVATTSASTQNYIGAFDDALIGGAGGIKYNWKGNMDQVRIYNVALSQANIQADMVSTAASVAGTVAYYNFDIGTPGGTNTGLTTLTDNSGSGNAGTLNNFALTGAISNWVESYAMVVPTATNASAIGGTNFTANWTVPVIGITDNYIVDVSTTPDFASPVAGSAFTVAFGTNTLTVTGLTNSTVYYYRVSSDKTSVTGVGAFSNTISLTTLAVLPVNLLSFNVSKGNAGTNQLQWSTATEQNGKFFELQRSEDGRIFTTITKINSSVSSSITKNYQYADNLPSNLAPVYYYRLKLVDIDGSYTYSEILLIKNSKAGTITLYPNPSQEKVIVNITDKNLLQSIATLSDISGKLLQTVVIKQTVTSINISTYKKGVYLLRLANGESLKLVKQ